MPPNSESSEQRHSRDRGLAPKRFLKRHIPATKRDAGDTLVEVLAALVVMALTVVALLGAFATSVVASGEQRGLANLDTVLKSYVEAATFQIEDQPYSAASNTFPIFAGCGIADANGVYYSTDIKNGVGAGLTGAQTTLYPVPAPFTASITNVQFWSGSSWGGCVPGSSTALNPQQLTATVKNTKNGTQASTIFTVSNPHVPAGVPSQVLFEQQPPSPSTTAATSFPISVVITDSLGHTTSSTAPVSLAITPNSGTEGAALSGCNSPTPAVNGVATFSCSINLAGAGYSLSASSTGLTSSVSNLFTVNPGPASLLAFNPNPPGGGAAVTANQIPGIIVEVTDAEGNVVPSVSGTVGLSIGSGPQTTFDPGSTASLPMVDGVANFSGGLAFEKLTTAGTYTFVATPTGFSVGGFSVPITSKPIVVASTPNPSIGLRFVTPPGGGPSGQAWNTQPVVAIQQGGATLTGDSTTVTLGILSSPGTASLQCPTSDTSVTTASGVATFAGCSIVGPVGSTYQLTATATAGSAIGSATSPVMTITVGTPAQLVFQTAPGGATKGSSLSPQPVLDLEDGGGNATNSTLAVTATLNVNGHSGALLTCAASTVVAVNGVATFSGCSINESGNGYTITFSAAGLQSITSSAFNIS